MQIYDTCVLIADAPEAHGVYAEGVTQTEHEVYCSISSVSMSESYQARSAGLFPDFRIKIAHEFEYNGEKKVRFRGVEYDVIRTYTSEEDGIELTVQRSTYAEGRLPGHA